MNKFLPNILSSKLKDNEISIFLFHGVYKKNNFLIRNYTKKHLEENIFEKCISELKKEANPLSMDDVIRIYENKEKIKGKNFVITFDDGFENNYSVAMPILDDLKIPATFYFSTDFIENNSMSWIDKIEYCIENTLQESIKLPWVKKKFLINTSFTKIKLLDYLRKKIKKDLSFNLNAFVTYMFNECKMKEIKSLNTEIDKKISWSQVKKIKTNKLFTVGGHGHEHFSFRSLSFKKFKEQIDKSFRLFERKINHKLEHYSYPEGQKIDFNKKISKYLKNKKILCCPSAIPGFNFKNTSLFELKRIPIIKR